MNVCVTYVGQVNFDGLSLLLLLWQIIETVLCSAVIADMT